MLDRCVNLDWFEVYCLEPVLHHADADFFLRLGWNVEVRAYGTPQYREMFTLLRGKDPFLEIRRNPYSVKSAGGLFPDGACHLRLVNSVLYTEDPVADLIDFMLKYDYKYHSITRCDIAVDFNRFDNQMQPAKFVADFFEGKFAKINQCKIAAHGCDRWDGRLWNSVSWGSPTSPIRTKLYNKTLELREHTDKPYIRNAWMSAGLDLASDIWRVEFSIKSAIKGYVSLEDGFLLKHRLHMYCSRFKQLFAFHILARHYFRFKEYSLTRDGKPQRKDRCPDVNLFVYGKDTAYKPIKGACAPNPQRMDKMLARRLERFILEDRVPDKYRDSFEDVLAFYRDRNYLVYGSDQSAPAVMEWNTAVQ